MMKFLQKNELVNQVYNDDVITFKSKVPKKDGYGTPIPGQYDFEEKLQSWFRTVGITSIEIVDAKSLDTDLTKKVAIGGNQEIDSKRRAFIGSRQFEIFRCYYNPNKDETEISLVEVNTNE